MAAWDDPIGYMRDLERQLSSIKGVLDEYFDFDVDPWDDHDAACPAPEDVWRLHRDLRAVL